MQSRKGCCAPLGEWLDARFFKALCDPSRLSILCDLAASGKRTVSEIGGCCPIDLSVVSRHLAILRDAKIVEAERQGKEVRYSINAPHVVSLLRGLADALEQCCQPEGDRNESRG